MKSPPVFLAIGDRAKSEVWSGLYRCLNSLSFHLHLAWGFIYCFKWKRNINIDLWRNSHTCRFAVEDNCVGRRFGKMLVFMSTLHLLFLRSFIGFIIFFCPVLL